MRIDILCISNDQHSLQTLQQHTADLISLTDNGEELKEKKETPFFEMILETNPTRMKADARLTFYKI